ncbi:hypothetical protein Ctob_001416 [Chrysochromulina tobinii]|uniref:Uncharacterized protein n=1 Tax=Chrysochromulina tobinii TaxID=1460289 RepID=A0A0M0J2Y0_9EUKA|nr:hypothetical protein Ctob_001416 [Chrysochromulina tobinii]|eukprot:KOO20901.1 hypothetical protein Ctob_001416 [Chrysochromulina sp. CCMP291]
MVEARRDVHKSNESISRPLGFSRAIMPLKMTSHGHNTRISVAFIKTQSEGMAKKPEKTVKAPSSPPKVGVATRRSSHAVPSPAPKDSPFVFFRAPPLPRGTFGFPKASPRAAPANAAAGGSELASEAVEGAVTAVREQSDWNGKLREHWNRKLEMERIKGLCEAIKQPPMPTPDTVGSPLPAADWEALPEGTRLKVWWEGSDEWFECTVLNWRVAIGEGGELFYTHRCLYDGGIFDHDLAKCDFEVLDVGHAWMFGADDSEASDDEEEALLAEGAAYGTNVDGVDELSPRRKWLIKQEAKLKRFQEELENADIKTPVIRADVARGRQLLRRLRLPNQSVDKRCVTPRLTTVRPGSDNETGIADSFRGQGTVRIVNPSDGDVSYRLLCDL